MERLQPKGINFNFKGLNLKHALQTLEVLLMCNVQLQQNIVSLEVNSCVHTYISNIVDLHATNILEYLHSYISTFFLAKIHSSILHICYFITSSHYTRNMNKTI